MDLYQAILSLWNEKRKIDRIIGALELLCWEQQPPKPPAKRRGRIRMSEEERTQVSQRMRHYWQQKRQNASSA
jgi:hypothetical protein